MNEWFMGLLWSVWTTRLLCAISIGLAVYSLVMARLSSKYAKESQRLLKEAGILD